MPICCFSAGKPGNFSSSSGFSPFASGFLPFSTVSSDPQLHLWFPRPKHPESLDFFSPRGRMPGSRASDKFDRVERYPFFFCFAQREKWFTPGVRTCAHMHAEVLLLSSFLSAFCFLSRCVCVCVCFMQGGFLLVQPWSSLNE